jgi:hypothetical protein
MSLDKDFPFGRGISRKGSWSGWQPIHLGSWSVLILKEVVCYKSGSERIKLHAENLEDSSYFHRSHAYSNIILFRGPSNGAQSYIRYQKIKRWRSSKWKGMWR